MKVVCVKNGRLGISAVWQNFADHKGRGVKLSNQLLLALR